MAYLVRRTSFRPRVSDLAAFMVTASYYTLEKLNPFSSYLPIPMTQEFANQVVLFLQDLPWVEIRRMVRLCTEFEGIPVLARASVAATTLLIVIGVNSLRARRGVNLQLVNAVGEAAVHAFLVVTVGGPQYPILFKIVNQLRFNGFKKITPLMVTLFVVLVTPSQIDKWLPSEPEEKSFLESLLSFFWK